jgi:predicted alpha-1,6-mannanase (GH76 family)
MIVDAMTHDEKGMNEMTKSNTKSRNVEIASIALKTLHDDIVRADSTFTRTTKQMRVILREKFAHIHERNASWTFTQSQYDDVRSHFDASYRAKLERANKRSAKTRTPRASRKIAVNDATATVVNNELHDA